MKKEQRTQKIDEFLEKFDEMIKAANDIEDFKFEIGVTIYSRDSMVSDRVRTINGINEIFSKNDMKWSSSNA